MTGLIAPIVCVLAVTVAQTAMADSGPTRSQGSVQRREVRPTLSAADKVFLVRAAQVFAAELKACELALDRADSGRTRAFAQRVKEDVQRSGAELQTLAAAKHVKLSLAPSDAEPRLSHLASARGIEFDRRHAADFGFGAQERTVRLFKTAAKSATDPDVRSFASSSLAVFQLHLQMSRDLEPSNPQLPGTLQVRRPNEGPADLVDASQAAPLRR